jgi:hypothetical protein
MAGQEGARLLAEGDDRRMLPDQVGEGIHGAGDGDLPVGI